MEELKESLWGDLCGLSKAAGKRTGEEEAARLRGVCLGLDTYERLPPTPLAQAAHQRLIESCFVEGRRRTRPLGCFLHA